MRFLPHELPVASYENAPSVRACVRACAHACVCVRMWVCACSSMGSHAWHVWHGCMLCMHVQGGDLILTRHSLPLAAQATLFVTRMFTRPTRAFGLGLRTLLVALSSSLHDHRCHRRRRRRRHRHRRRRRRRLVIALPFSEDHSARRWLSGPPAMWPHFSPCTMRSTRCCVVTTRWHNAPLLRARHCNTEWQLCRRCHAFNNSKPGLSSPWPGRALMYMARRFTSFMVWRATRLSDLAHQSRMLRRHIGAA